MRSPCRYGGMAYYSCFGIKNKLGDRRTVRVRINADCLGMESWSNHRHMVLRRNGSWSQLDPACLHKVPDKPDSLEVELELPGVVSQTNPEAGGADNTIFVSNFHWWPYSEMAAYINGLKDVIVSEIGRSFQQRAIYAVELGSKDNAAPRMVHAQTPQPSEMGSLACRAMLDFLLTDDPRAAALKQRFRICFVPMTNPDGTVLGYGVSDARGRFPYFEGNLAAENDSGAAPKTIAVWKYLCSRSPWLFWEWHSNNWPGGRGTCCCVTGRSC